MKKLALSAMTAWLSISAPAFAEKLDMSTVTCTQLAAMNEDEIAWYLIWLDGWLAGQADNTMLDIDELGAQIDGIGKACEAAPESSVINAAKAYLDG